MLIVVRIATWGKRAQYDATLGHTVPREDLEPHYSAGKMGPKISWPPSAAVRSRSLLAISVASSGLG